MLHSSEQYEISEMKKKIRRKEEISILQLHKQTTATTTKNQLEECSK